MDGATLLFGATEDPHRCLPFATLSAWACIWLLAKWSAHGRKSGVQEKAGELLKQVIDESCQDLTMEIAFDQHACATASAVP